MTDHEKEELQDAACNRLYLKWAATIIGVILSWFTAPLRDALIISLIGVGFIVFFGIMHICWVKMLDRRQIDNSDEESDEEQ